MPPKTRTVHLRRGGGNTFYFINFIIFFWGGGENGGEYVSKQIVVTNDDCFLRFHFLIIKMYIFSLFVVRRDRMHVRRRQRGNNRSVGTRDVESGIDERRTKAQRLIFF